MATRSPLARTVTAAPFVKWAGGKRQLVPELLDRAPREFGRYLEPFVGGGAMFFALQPERAVLSDLNHRLIDTYRGIQTDVEGVIARLTEYRARHSREFFEHLRGEDIDARRDPVETAAWLIYLNKTAYNGLYRVNRQGKFNAPFGSYKNPTICDEANLRAVAERLAGVELKHQGFEMVEQDAEPGDFVYFDPPYAPLSETANFTGYTRDGFDHDCQIVLRNVARRLKAKGVHVLLSNSAAPAIRELYAEGFLIEEVAATRLINSKADRRGPIPELVIR